MEDLDDLVKETREDDEIPVSPPASRAIGRAKTKKSLSIKKTVKIISLAKSIKYSNNVDNSNSELRKLKNYS